MPRKEVSEIRAVIFYLSCDSAAYTHNHLELANHAHSHLSTHSFPHWTQTSSFTFPCPTHAGWCWKPRDGSAPHPAWRSSAWVGWEREAEARHAVIKMVGSASWEKGGTEKRLLEVKTSSLEEEILERKVGVWLFFSLDSGLQARPPRRPSDSMVILFKYLPWLPITPRVKHKLIRFAQRYSASSSYLIFYFSTHIIFTPDTPNHLNSLSTFTHLHLCTSRILHLKLLIWKTSMHPSKSSFTNASSRRLSPNPLLSWTLVFPSLGPSSTPSLTAQCQAASPINFPSSKKGMVKLPWSYKKSPHTGPSRKLHMI